MRITSFEFSFIKSFKTLKFDLDRTSVLVGQNDHGKSSILKAIDIVLSRIEKDMINEGLLHPDLAERLLPIFSVNAKARRITVNYESSGKKKSLHITIRTNLSFVIHEKVERNAKTTPSAVDVFLKLQSHNKFLLIPALRDSSSIQFQELFSRILKERGLDTIIPQKAGGTPKEYRKLKAIRDNIAGSIKPYIDEKLLPEIQKYFGFQAEHKLALKFDTEVQDVGEWILSNLKLGFQLDESESSTLALSEAGTGVQSGVLLALHRLEQQAVNQPNVQYILAVEEPEAFLHPQKQRELYHDLSP
jgi:predicted ATP-dependent endonuclease of OLD family